MRPFTLSPKKNPSQAAGMKLNYAAAEAAAAAAGSAAADELLGCKGIFGECIYLYICTYIYIHTHIYICMYMYRNIAGVGKLYIPYIYIYIHPLDLNQT